MASARKSQPVDFSRVVDTRLVSGKTVICTGGASGIGLALCTALAKAGAMVVLADINVELGRKAADEIAATGLRCIFIQVDTMSYASQLAMFKQALIQCSTSSIDIVIPCAGLRGHSFITDMFHLDSDGDPEAPNTKVLDANGYGVLYTTYLAIFFARKAASLLQGSNPDRAGLARPQILFVSSFFGYWDCEYSQDYAFAKWGVRGLWRSIRGRPQDTGYIRCNLLAPTFAETPMLGNLPGMLESKKVSTASTADTTDAAMRCICDESVEGRAIAVTDAKGSAPGSGNFDINDDDLGGDQNTTGRNLLAGAFGSPDNMLDCLKTLTDLSVRTDADKL